MLETIIRIPGKLVASEYGTKLANVSDLDNDVYGPYTSVTAAHSALSAAGLNTIATTVGIIDDNNEVKEYWYQGGTEQVNLVKKVLGKENDAVSFDGFIILEPVTIIEGSAFEPDAILYSRNANRFVAKKGNNYYDNWEERVLYNNGNEPYTNKLYPYNGKSYTWNGTTFEAESAEAVKYNAQTLTVEQKEQAAQNIGLDVVVKGDVQQSFSDAQRVQAQNNMMGKAYSSVAADHSGLGKVYLAKNNGVLTQAMMPIATQENEEDPGRNTVYVIQYDYTMSGNITVPAGCTLEFDGGSISSGNYTLTGNNTRIKAERTTIFPVTKIAGTWNVGNIYSEWFGDVTQNNNIKKLFALTDSNVTNNVYIAVGTYNVSALANEDAIIAPKSNTIVHLSGTIALAGNSFTNYYIVNIENVSNVTFEGGNIIGDRDTHTGTTGEWGMGINIGDAHDITVKNVNVTKCWGDGIYVGGSGNTYNISIDSFIISDCRRQGISVTEVDNATINNGKISKIDGTLPKACVDIEPNTNDITRNITLSNLYCDNYSGGTGRGIYLYGPNGTIENINIKSCNVLAGTGLSIESVKNVSVEGTHASGTLVIRTVKNVFVGASEFETGDLAIGNEDVNFTNCRFHFSNTVTIHKYNMESCHIYAADNVIVVNASTSNCIIETNKYIYVQNNFSKNLQIKSTKGEDSNYYPVRAENCEINGLSISIVDSEKQGSTYAYINGNNCRLNNVLLESEISMTLLAYCNKNVFLNDVKFVNGTTEKWGVNAPTANVVIPNGCIKKGATTERPDLRNYGVGVKGFEYFDLTLMKPTYWTGDVSGGKSGWVDATGSDVPTPQS